MRTKVGQIVDRVWLHQELKDMGDKDGDVADGVEAQVPDPPDLVSAHVCMRVRILCACNG